MWLPTLPQTGDCKFVDNETYIRQMSLEGQYVSGISDFLLEERITAKELIFVYTFRVEYVVQLTIRPSCVRYCRT